MLARSHVPTRSVWLLRARLSPLTRASSGLQFLPYVYFNAQPTCLHNVFTVFHPPVRSSGGVNVCVFWGLLVCVRVQNNSHAAVTYNSTQVRGIGTVDTVRLTVRLDRLFLSVCPDPCEA